MISKGLRLSVDLMGAGASDIIGYQAKRDAPAIDLAKIGHYDPLEFWNPCAGMRHGRLSSSRESLASNSAGERLKKMMEMGLSRPWPEALHALTGQRQMDATAMLDYFAPLNMPQKPPLKGAKKWLDEQNREKPVGW